MNNALVAIVVTLALVAAPAVSVARADYAPPAAVGSSVAGAIQQVEARSQTVVGIAISPTYENAALIVLDSVGTGGSGGGSLVSFFVGDRFLGDNLERPYGFIVHTVAATGSSVMVTYKYGDKWSPGPFVAMD